MSENQNYPWADEDLSLSVEWIAATGETQFVEFKAEFPRQISDIGKEIAAFATTNDGTIFIGISDDGNICGIEDGFNQSVRSALVQRIEGVCHGPIAPSVTPSVQFAVVNGKVVAAVRVSRGPAPVYYASNIPYLRQVTAARPMKPDEVVDAIVQWQRANNPSLPATPESRFLTDLANFLVESDVALEDSFTFTLKPWVEEVRSWLANLSEEAREFSARATGEFINMRENLDQIARSFGRIASERPAIGRSSLPIMEERHEARTAIQSIRDQWFGPDIFSNAANNANTENVVLTIRMLDDLSSRSDLKSPDFRILPTLEEAAKRGLELERAASLGAGLEKPSRISELRQIGADLRQLQTRRMPMDGGRSIARILDDLREINNRAQLWLSTLR